MCFLKKGVIKNFAKFTGKHMCQSLFFNKIAGLRPTPPVPVSEVKTDSINNILCWYS